MKILSCIVSNFLTFFGLIGQASAAESHEAELSKLLEKEDVVETRNAAQGARTNGFTA